MVIFGSPTITGVPVLERVVSDVTVAYPRYSLFGQRLTVLPERSGRGPAFVVVALPDGRRRSIRLASTDLARATREAEGSPADVPRISIRTLTPLARHLRAALSLLAEEVIRDDSSRPSASRSVSVEVRFLRPTTFPMSAPGYGQAGRRRRELNSRRRWRNSCAVIGKWKTPQGGRTSMLMTAPFDDERVTTGQRAKLAYIYVRQSSVNQVRQHQESTEPNMVSSTGGCAGVARERIRSSTRIWGSGAGAQRLGFQKRSPRSAGQRRSRCQPRLTQVTVDMTVTDHATPYAQANLA